MVYYIMRIYTIFWTKVCEQDKSDESVVRTNLERDVVK